MKGWAERAIDTKLDVKLDYEAKGCKEENIDS